MRNSVFTLQRMLLWVFVCLSVGIFGQAAVAQETTSNLRVIVADAAGNRVSGVDVRITHGPTGRSQVLTSTDGSVTAVGLQVGGPYSVEAADRTQYAAEESEGIYLALGETEVV